jgi:hypothetical protein
MAVLGFLSFVALSMTALFFYLRSAAPTAFEPAVRTGFPAPALQTRPGDDLRAFAAQQQEALSSYAWVDRAKGIARIPIDEAMSITAAKGARAYDPPAPSMPPTPDGRHP